MDQTLLRSDWSMICHPRGLREMFVLGKIEKWQVHVLALIFHFFDLFTNSDGSFFQHLRNVDIFQCLEKCTVDLDCSERECTFRFSIFPRMRNGTIPQILTDALHILVDLRFCNCVCWFFVKCPWHKILRSVKMRHKMHTKFMARNLQGCTFATANAHTESQHVFHTALFLWHCAQTMHTLTMNEWLLNQSLARPFQSLQVSHTFTWLMEKFLVPSRWTFPCLAKNSWTFLEQHSVKHLWILPLEEATACHRLHVHWCRHHSAQQGTWSLQDVRTASQLRTPLANGASSVPSVESRTIPYD